MANASLDFLRGKWIERAEALQLKGKKRDAACIDYLAGALVAAEIWNTEDVGPLSAAIFAVSFRGCREFEKGGAK